MVLALRPRAEKAAAMEPRRDDGDDEIGRGRDSGRRRRPQWSPVVTTGTTLRIALRAVWCAMPQWSPVVTTGTTARRIRAA